MEVWSAAGRRKSAVAQVRICSPGTGAITVNQVDAEKYLQGAFPTILKPFETVKLEPTFDLYIRSQGEDFRVKQMQLALAVPKLFA